MDKSSYTFQSLSSKYGDFRGPAFTVKVNGKELKSTEVPLSVEVDLCADGSAGGCRFQLEGLYDYGKSKWLDDLLKTIEVGCELSVKGGYVKQEEIFYGYVDECTVEYSGYAPPRISVTGIDGFGYLMSCQEPVYGENKQAKAVVQELLNKVVSAGYAKKATVGSLSGYSTPLVKEKVDDFKYLKVLAERYGMNVFAVDGELIFDDVLSGGSPILSLTVGMGLMSFSRRVGLQGQVGEVEIWGRDEKQHFIKGGATRVTVCGAGDTAAQLATKFKKTSLREYSEFVRTDQECVTLAQARLNALAMNFVAGSGTCVGIQELIPGRFIEIKGLDGDSVGTYFISKVHHRFNQEGYSTQFEVKGAKA